MKVPCFDSTEDSAFTVLKMIGLYELSNKKYRNMNAHL